MDVSVVGLGTLGSWTALALSKMGLPLMSIRDDDIVEEVNVGLQVYDVRDTGFEKTDTLGRFLEQNGAAVDYHDKWSGETLNTRLIVTAVDDWDLRQTIFDRAPGRRSRHLIDLRSGGESLIIYTVDLRDDAARQAYLQSFEVTPYDLDCRSQGVVYVGMRAGVEVAATVAAILRGRPYPFQQVVSSSFFDTEVAFAPGAVAPTSGDVARPS